MTILAIILSGLALFAAAAALGLAISGRIRGQKQNTALMDYADTVGAGVLKKADDRTDARISDLEKVYEKRISDLEKGIVPDFEKAKAAADAVNDFNAGISGILGFDPHDVLKKQRKEGGEIL